MDIILPLIGMALSIVALVMQGHGVILLWIAGIGIAGVAAVWAGVWWLFRERPTL